MTENKPSDTGIPCTDDGSGVYVLKDVYQQVDGGYFAESPLNSGILRAKQNQDEDADR